jgi:hypothetical protein
MACYLKTSGKEFHVDSFLEQTQLQHLASSIFHVGESRVLKSYGAYEDNGCSFVASNAEMDNYEQQISDTIQFLEEHRKSLDLLKSVYAVEDLHLDFGVEADFPNGLTKSYILPKELLKLCGELQIDILMTTFLSSGH